MTAVRAAAGSSASPSSVHIRTTIVGKPPSRPPRERNAVLGAYLAADPERGRRAYHKQHGDRLARKLDRPEAGLPDLAAALRGCGDLLVYSPHGDLLGPHRRCGRRLCPTCQAYRATKYSNRVGEAIPRLVALKGHWVFITLTLRNVPIAETGAAIQHVHRSLHKLRRRREWTPRGWIRNTENTLNLARGESHPHVHILALMPADYYERPARVIRRKGGGRPKILPGYIEKARLQAMWQEALGVDYKPIVDIRPMRWSNEGERAAAIAEICKYGQKPAELCGLAPADLVTLIEQLAQHRTFAVCGELRRYITAPSDWPAQLERLIVRGRAEGPVPRRAIGELALWNPKLRRYDLVPAGEEAPRPPRTGYAPRDLRGLAPPLGPMPSANAIGDVWYEPENYPSDRREEASRVAKRQRAHPERTFYRPP